MHTQITTEITKNPDMPMINIGKLTVLCMRNGSVTKPKTIKPKKNNMTQREIRERPPAYTNKLIKKMVHNYLN